MPKKVGRPRLYANARDRQRACRARRKASAPYQLDAAATTVPAVDHADHGRAGAIDGVVYRQLDVGRRRVARPRGHGPDTARYR